MRVNALSVGLYSLDGKFFAQAMLDNLDRISIGLVVDTGYEGCLAKLRGGWSSLRLPRTRISRV